MSSWHTAFPRSPPGTARPEVSGESGQLEVVDWRRRVTALYSAVRTNPDPAIAHARWQAGRDDLLRGHPASPVPAHTRSTYPGADFPDYDPAYRFVVPLLSASPEVREIPTASEGITRFVRIGRLMLPGLGSLDAWWLTSYGNGLFVPFQDSTSGSTSYGAGRYLLDTVKGADLGGDLNAVVLDLNFAYQPSCAYDADWACPLPAAGNVLAAPVPVGERYHPPAES
jgi:uncharacterized protein (DUF1684 family)